MNKIFNKAIYKANLKRFWVGSGLYLVILLLCSNFWDVYPGMENFQDDFFPYKYYFKEQFYISNILSMFVAVVVSSLVFRFLHSKKQSVFLHSCPVTRSASYITTLLSAFTLMTVPVIITGLVISIATNKFLWGLMWIGYTIFALLSYFSVATFSAMLTGTTYITFVLYFGLLYITQLIRSFIDSVMQIFAAGYWGSGDWAVFKIFNITESLNDIMYPQSSGFVWSGIESTITLLIHWVVLLLLSFILYKIRNMEKCEDTAAYKWFYYVVKYMAVSVSAMIVFLVFENDLSLAWMIWTLCITFIVYFGVEMVLRKEIKVWGAYKGYIVFLIGFALFLLFMAKSTIFGFETYRPDLDKVSEMQVMNVGLGGSFTDYESIEKLYNYHGEIIESEIKELMPNNESERILIGYNTNGDWIYREYFIPRAKRYEIMDAMYESEKFKIQTNEVFDIPEDKNFRFTIYEYRGGKIADAVSVNEYELLKCVKTDILNKSFTELHEQKGYIIEFCYQGESDVEYCSVTINQNWTETINWLKENGYGYSWKR